MEEEAQEKVDIYIYIYTYAAAAKSFQLCPTLCDPTRLPRPWDSPYNYDWFMLIYGRDYHNIVKQFPPRKKVQMKLTLT